MLLSRRKLLKVGTVGLTVLAAPAIIKGIRKFYHPDYGRFQFEEVTENVFAVRKRFTGFELIEELFGVKTAYAWTSFSPPPNDPNYTNQWHLDASHLNVINAWTIAQGDPATTIAILGTGVTLINGEYPVSAKNGWNSLGGNNNTADPNGHDSLTTAIAMINTNNSTGSAGIAPGCTLNPIIVCTAGGNCGSDFFDGAGIDYARTSGSDIISMSWSTTESPGGVIYLAIAAAWAAGCVLFTVTSDTSQDIKVNEPLQVPLFCPNVVGVAGLDSADHLWINAGHTVGDGSTGSGYNGQKIMCYSGGTTPVSNQTLCTTDKNGTTGCGIIAVSFATPQAAGVAGLMKRVSGAPVLTNDELVPLLLGSCRLIGTAVAYPGVPDPFYGHGVVEANAALVAVQGFKRRSIMGG